MRDEFLKHYAYDAETGHMFWRHHKYPALIGRRADHFHEHKGFMMLTLHGKQYKAHRVIWLMVYGEPMPKIIDHIDRNSANNQLANLREATPSLNAGNSTRHVDKKDDLPAGITYRVRNTKRPYQVKLQSSDNNIRVEQYFATRDEAEAYCMMLKASIGVIHDFD